MMITPDIHALELDITYACGFGCHNCNRMTVIAPGTKSQNVSPDQLARMLAESVDSNHKWWRFSVLGGEPTTHPQFEEMMGLLAAYKRNHNRSLLIRVISHGQGSLAATRLAWLRGAFPEIGIRNTNKRTIEQPFDAVNLSPEDMKPEWSKTHKYQGCKIPRNCGIGFNFSGFYCCAVAGAIDRVWQLRSAIKHVQELTSTNLIAMYDAMCSKCGHYQRTRESKFTPMSSGWRRSLELYEDRTSEIERF